MQSWADADSNDKRNSLEKIQRCCQFFEILKKIEIVRNFNRFYQNTLASKKIDSNHIPLSKKYFYRFILSVADYFGVRVSLETSNLKQYHLVLKYIKIFGRIKLKNKKCNFVLKWLETDKINAKSIRCCNNS